MGKPSERTSWPRLVTSTSSSIPEEEFSCEVLPPTLKVAASATNLNPDHSPEHRLETRVEIKFSLSQESFKKLEEVKAALSNKLGSGASVEEIFNELMNRYLKAAQPKSKGPEKCEKSEGVEGKPKNSPAISKKFPIRQKKSTNRYIPQGIRRAVIQRDKSVCTYVASDGTRCGCKVFLNLDHIQPFSLGGEHSAENLRVLCRAHNLARNKEAQGISS